MKRNIFDVLVVYSEKIASSASSNKQTTPFSVSDRAQYNLAYEYFIQSCNEKGVTAAFSTTKDITGPGLCNSFWLFENGKWTKIKEEAYSTIIFDKFSPVDKKLKASYKTLFRSSKVEPFNSKYLHKLFDDKKSTFNALKAFSIPTVALDAHNGKSVSKSIERINKLIDGHTNKEDFSKSLILKDRFGAGGKDIYMISKNFKNEILSVLKKNKNKSFIIQPFVKFDKGYEYANFPTATDIRIIFQNEKIIQTYIRMAKKNDFRCNEHQGGTVKYISVADIPTSVIGLSRKIVGVLNEKRALYALDFIISNNGNIYLLEGNINPGIYWGTSSSEDETYTKKLIHNIVNELLERSQYDKVKHINNNIKPKIILPQPALQPTIPLRH